MPSLSAVARHEYYTELGNSLPPPMTDTPDYRQRRLTTAVEAFEVLCPGDAYEASLAVRIVLAGAHAVETLREAGVYREDFAKRKSCRAQAAGMMREERAAKRMLAQEQKLRLATEAVAGPAPAQPALASVSLPQAEPQAEPQAAPPRVQAAAPPPLPVLAPSPVAAPSLTATHAPPHLPVQAGSAPPPSPEAIAKAEAFVDEDVVAAAQIRHDRGVTPQNRARFRHLTLPSDPAVIDALVRGTSDVLSLLDEVGDETLNAAA